MNICHTASDAPESWLFVFVAKEWNALWLPPVRKVLEVLVFTAQTRGSQQ
jgi:hypothetical protein